MKNRFDKKFAKDIESPLGLRVYTSRLLGADEDLVLHGGGNTSLKYGDTLYVKGSGWDLGSIEEGGFAPVDLETLSRMAEEQSLSDRDMVIRQKAAMKNADAPNPSVEAILHAIIPYLFVDHTHADAIVTLSNTPSGREIFREIYGERVLVIDYVMPGFKLAKKVYELTREIEWDSLDGIVLMHHGVFTFSNDAEESYNKMIDLVTTAENYIARYVQPAKCKATGDEDVPEAKELAEAVSNMRGKRTEVLLLRENSVVCLSQLREVERIVKSGGLTPEHVIRTKPFPMIVGESGPIAALKEFKSQYEEYFAAFNTGREIKLDSAPRWAILKGGGALIFPADEKERKIISDIVIHTAKAMLTAEKLGGWSSLNHAELFEMEYWELGQAKLKREDR
jgi:rhamnose utilization protein RhaD (predicted bifunctional aldolase and dehydrogenase)